MVRTSTIEFVYSLRAHPESEPDVEDLVTKHQIAGSFKLILRTFYN
jgi:hypothetical protein